MSLGWLARKADAVKALRASGCTDPFVLLIDFDHFRAGVRACRSAFPQHWKHCFAIKANPTRLCLVEASKEGLGFEAASIGELRMSQRASKRAFVVYDSPLKTYSELKEAVSLGVAVITTFFFSFPSHLPKKVNVDNMQELDNLASILGEQPNKDQYFGVEQRAFV